MLHSATFTFPVLSTTDGAEWAAASNPVVGYSRGIAVMPDGRTMVRPALTFGSDGISFNGDVEGARPLEPSDVHLDRPVDQRRARLQ